MTLKALGVAVALTLGTGGAHAANSTLNNNFTMLGGTGVLNGGANDVVFSWDRSLRSAVVTDGSSNAALFSVTPFSGNRWTAHHVNLYGPGTYVFDTSCPAGNPACGSTSTRNYTLVVGAGQVGGHLLFDWNGNLNIDVVQLWEQNKSWEEVDLKPVGTWQMNTALSNAAGNAAITVWSLVSIDTPASTFSSFPNGTNTVAESNTYHGTRMIDGPLIGFSANFNLMTPAPAAVPVPAAAWLLGSGLMGLAGVGYRRKAVRGT